MASNHPFYCRIRRTGKPVIEVSVYGLTHRQHVRLSVVLDKMSTCWHTSDISGLYYFTSPRAARRVAANLRRRGYAVTETSGKIDRSGVSYAFEAMPLLRR